MLIQPREPLAGVLVVTIPLDLCPDLRDRLLALGLQQQALGLLALAGVGNDAVEQSAASLDQSWCQGGKDAHGAASTQSATRFIQPAAKAAWRRSLVMSRPRKRSRVASTR